MTALREAYERDGVVRVEGAIAAGEVRAMRDCVRARIAALELVEVTGALRPARGTELAMWAIGREPALATMPAAFAGALERVFGSGVWAQVADELGGLAMPNLPCPGPAWTACGEAWHVDEPTPPGPAVGQVMLGFACLDRVESGGGATVVITGSPRRLAALAEQRGEEITTDVALAALAREEPWFAELRRAGGLDAHGLRAGCVSAGVPLRAVELIGEPGDVLLMDPRCLHTTSANVSARARLTMRLTAMRA